MPPSRAARGRLAAVLAVLLPLLLAGCGTGDRDRSTGASDETPVSGADAACRAEWAALGATAKQRSRTGVDLREAFASRWNSVSAGIDYYVETATAKDCDDLLAGRRTAVEEVTALVTQGLAYDAGQRRVSATALRAPYAAVAKGAREPARVKRAYTVLSAQTPAASQDLAPAYAELARADPTDQKALARAVADLELLARASQAYQATSAALATIDGWHDSLIAKARS